MHPALHQFEQNLTRARNLAGLSVSLSSQTTGAIDTSDMLRAAIVLSVSALDQFVHEFTRIEMLRIQDQSCSSTVQFDNFKVRLEAVNRALLGDPSTDWLEPEIRRTLGWQTFQLPDRIADAIRLISPINLWDAIATNLNQDVDSVKDRLRALVDRRNKIAHEADLDPTNPGEHWPINRNMVEDALDFVDSIVHEISGIPTCS